MTDEDKCVALLERVEKLERQVYTTAKLLEVVQEREDRLRGRVEKLENRGPGEWTVPASWKEPIK